MNAYITNIPGNVFCKKALSPPKVPADRWALNRQGTTIGEEIPRSSGLGFSSLLAVGCVPVFFWGVGP